jgi:ribosomal protein S6--L-glutamate ligase
MGGVVALVSGFGWHVEDLSRAARRIGVGFEAIEFDRIMGRVGGRSGVHAGALRLDDASAVLVRMMPPGSLEQVVFRMDALHRLEAAGVPVVNPPRAVEAAVDKYLALARLEAAGLAVPHTWCGEHADDALAAFDALGRDVVVKPLFGSEGRGMTRVADREVLWRVAHALERVGSVLYLQEFIPGADRDLRAFVVGERVVAAMERTAAPGQWRANVAQGGSARPVVLGDEEARTAVAAAAAIGARVAGVDLVRDRSDRLLVIEVNAVPGWRALAAATDVDVAEAILDEVRELARC